MIAGDCWAHLCGTVPGLEPLPQERVLLCGASDVDAGERARLDASADVLDPAVARANAFATPGGLTVADAAVAVARAI